MRIAIDSDSLPTATRLATWRSMLCDTYMGMDCSLPANFRSVIEGHAVADHTLTRITSTRHTVERSPTLIKRDGLEIVFFGIALAGRAVIAQSGQEAVLERGAIIVSDTSRPFKTHIGAASDIVWLGVPKKPIAERLRSIEDHVAIAFRPSTPVEQIAVDFMAGLDEALARDLHGRETERLMGQILDLLAMTILSDEMWPKSSLHLAPRWPIQ